MLGAVINAIRIIAARPTMSSSSIRIGVVSTRLAGTDGVSLESAKWCHVLHDLGHTCYYFAGECDRPIERSRLVAEAHFSHPRVAKATANLFDHNTHRTPETTETIHDLRVRLKRELHSFIKDFGIQLLTIENALSLPMNVPLGLALAELIAETNIPTIAHHHDFYWERDRFTVNAARDFLHAAFPPAIPGICHVVINSYAATELARRTGMRSFRIPNVMDFDHDPSPGCGLRSEVRRSLGLADDDTFLLQPTRVVPRKCIERSIELANWLDRPCKLVVSHGSGDEGDQYARYLARLAESLNVPLVFGDEFFDYEAGVRADGRKVYSLADAYLCCDLVTYPSRVEGFGNAFLEAIYYRRPLLISGYEIFRTDIEPQGFRVVQMDGFVTEQTLQEVEEVLANPQLVEEITDHNFELGRRHYSLHVLRERVAAILDHRFPEL